MFEKGFRFRRLRLKPKLTDKHKAEWLAWYLNNRNTDFSNYVFGDETTIRQNEFPRYQLRKRTSNPCGFEGGDKYFYKVNLFGLISKRGPNDFYVITYN